MRRALRIGLIGAGLIGRKHAGYLKASSDCVLAAIADPSPDAKEVTIEYGAAFYLGFEEMMALEDLDGVIIAAPNDRHEEIGIAASANRLPMIIEKPIATDLQASSRLTEAAARAGVPLLVGHHRRYNPNAKKARALVREGALGRLVAVNTIWSVKKPEAYFEATWRTEPGGGPILINLIHEIDLLRFICGEIIEVMALKSQAVRGFAVEDSASIALRFENGALASILVSDTGPSPWSFEQATGENHPVFPKNNENPTRLIGAEAALEFPSLKLWRHDGDVDWHNPLSKKVFPEPDIDVFSEQIAHFARVIRGEEEPIITGEDASRSLAATLAVIKAADTERVIRLP